VVKKIVASCDFSEQEEEKENEIKKIKIIIIIFYEWMENIFLFRQNKDNFNKKLKGKTLKIQIYLFRILFL